VCHKFLAQREAVRGDEHLLDHRNDECLPFIAWLRRLIDLAVEGDMFDRDVVTREIDRFLIRNLFYSLVDKNFAPMNIASDWDQFLFVNRYRQLFLEIALSSICIRTIHLQLLK